MWLVICGVVIWLLIVWGLLSVTDDGDGIGIALFIIGMIGALIAWNIDSKARIISYPTEVKELQLVEGEYLRPQGTDYVIKWGDEIRIINKSKIYTVHSDTSYFEIEYKKTIKNYSQSRQRWIPGKQVNDTTYRINKYYLYRNLNE